MKFTGISEGFHDASIAVVEGNQILFAAQAERYTRVKNDKRLPLNLRKLTANTTTIFYEDTKLKNERRKKYGMLPSSAGQYIDTHMKHH